MSAGIGRIERDLRYLEQADAHADEGVLGEPAARAILQLAVKYAKQTALLIDAAQTYIDHPMRETRLALEAALAKARGEA